VADLSAELVTLLFYLFKGGFYVTVAIVDERAPDAAVSALASRGFRVIKAPGCNGLPEATRSHPDMLLFSLGRSIVVTEEYYSLAKGFFLLLSSLVPNLKIIKSKERLSREYPNDCKLNALPVGNRLFAKTDSVSGEVISLAKEAGLIITHTKQGYPSCSVLAPDGSHAVTADAGMAKLLCRYGIEVLKIDACGIRLPPYEYGFIGGASGTHGNEIYFYGDLSTHKDGELIRNFCISAGYAPISLCDGPLIDLGRIIFIDSD